MYEYFAVDPEIWEEVAGFSPRFLHWLPKHRLSTPSRCSLEIWRLMIDNLNADDVSSSSSFFWNLWHLAIVQSLLILSSFVTFQLDLNPWARCERYAKCKRALELNGRLVLFEYGHGRYWYLGDQVLPQVEHEYPPTTILAPPCHTVRLADFLADEVIARVHNGYIVVGVEGNYSEFIRLHLQGCLVGKTVLFFPSKVKFLILQILFHISAW